MRKAHTESDKRLQLEIRARQEAEHAREQRERESYGYRITAEDAQYDSILNAIQAAQADAERAQYEIAAFSEAGDHKAVAESNRRLARAESRLAQLEDGKAAIEDQKSREAARLKAAHQQPQQQQPQRQFTVEEYIDQIPNLLQSQKDWLKSHPETMTDNRVNTRLQAAHFETEELKYRPGSKEYFKHIEERLGYAKPEGEEEEEEMTRTPVAAPPSKSATSPTTGRPSSSKITLTPEQREMAALSGIDEVTYAKNLVRMQQAKRDGLIN
jgi:hypothetical protein